VQQREDYEQFLDTNVLGIEAAENKSFKVKHARSLRAIHNTMETYGFIPVEVSAFFISKNQTHFQNSQLYSQA